MARFNVAIFPRLYSQLNQRLHTSLENKITLLTASRFEFASEKNNLSCLIITASIEVTVLNSHIKIMTNFAFGIYVKQGRLLKYMAVCGDN